MQARERRIREQVATHRCDYCGSDYVSSRVHILARRSSAWVVMVACPQCLRQAILFVSFPRSGSRQASLEGLKPTRPMADDAPQPLPASLDAPLPVTPHDVAEMRRFLTAFDGDFKRLFG